MALSYPSIPYDSLLRKAKMEAPEATLDPFRSHGTGMSKSREASQGQSRDELLEVYRDQVEFLRRELERKDTLLMSLMQRVPELEAAPEPRYAPEAAAEGAADR